MKTKQSHVYRKKKVMSLVIRISIAVVATVVCIWLISLLWNASWFRIDSVHVYMGDESNARIAQNRIEDLLRTSYVGIFNKSNTFFYPESDIKAILEDISSTTDAVDIKRDTFHTLRISSSEKTAVAIICAGLPEVIDNIVVFNPDQSECYFTDKSGVKFAKATDTLHTKKIFYFPDTLASSTDMFDRLYTAYNTFVDAGIPVDGFLVHNRGEYEVFSGQTTVYLNENHGLFTQVENVIAFWKHMNKACDYIDARYGANVFYKLL